jgi:hypothetical protein
MSMRSMVLALVAGLAAACGTTVTTARIPAFPTRDFPTLWEGETPLASGLAPVAAAGEHPTGIVSPVPSAPPPSAPADGDATAAAPPPTTPSPTTPPPAELPPAAPVVAAPVPVTPSGVCRRDLDCVAGAMCFEGSCVARPKGRRFQLTFDLVPRVEGWWSVSGGKGQSGSSGSLSAGMSFGGTLAWFREYSPQRGFGFYLGFVRSPMVHATEDGNPDAVVGAESRFTLVRGGVLLRGYAFTSEHVWCGGSLEGGLAGGKLDQAGIGPELIPSLVCDFALGRGPSRTFIATAIGLNMGLHFESNKASDQTATFFYFMVPMLRLGMGFGS